MSVKNTVIALFVVLFLAFIPAKGFAENYAQNTSDMLIEKSISLLEGSNYHAINVLEGENVTKKPITVQFTNLSLISAEYMNSDAVTILNDDNTMAIYIDSSLKNSPPEAIACLLAHETMHNDATSSLEEEVAAWTKEATSWIYFVKKNPSLAKMDESKYALVERLNYLSRLYVSAGNTSDAIRQEVIASEGYTKLALHSEGY